MQLLRSFLLETALLRRSMAVVNVLLMGYCGLVAWLLAESPCSTDQRLCDRGDELQHEVVGAAHCVFSGLFAFNAWAVNSGGVRFVRLNTPTLVGFGVVSLALAVQGLAGGMRVAVGSLLAALGALLVALGLGLGRVLERRLRALRHVVAIVPTASGRAEIFQGPPS